MQWHKLDDLKSLFVLEILLPFHKQTLTVLKHCKSLGKRDSIKYIMKLIKFSTIISMNTQYMLMMIKRFLSQFSFIYFKAMNSLHTE